MIPGLPLEPFYYLATPYTRYPQGIDAAFQHAACVAGNLLRQGYRVYSPIVQGHPMAVHAAIDPLDHAIWLPFNDTMMKLCDALIVAKLASWDQSKGVLHEIAEYRRAGKRVFELEIDQWVPVSGGGA